MVKRKKMALLIDIISDRYKQRYKDNAVELTNNASANIESGYYRIPNNGWQSANQFWYNLLLITPCADGHTYTRAFMPSEKENMIVRARFSNHPCGPLSNWKKYELLGAPNKRVDIFFSAEEDSDSIGGDVESHCINFRHLYNDDDVTKLRNALLVFFKTRNFVNPFVPSNAENSNVIKITEAQLKQVIIKAIHKILY